MLALAVRDGLQSSLSLVGWPLPATVEGLKAKVMNRVVVAFVVLAAALAVSVSPVAARDAQDLRPLWRLAVV
jgi:hypothetical protein